MFAFLRIDNNRARMAWCHFCEKTCRISMAIMNLFFLSHLLYIAARCATAWLLYIWIFPIMSVRIFFLKILSNLAI